MRTQGKWLEEILHALVTLGGKGTLEDIYSIIEKRNMINLDSYVDWKSQIRKHIYLHSSDCDIFKGSIGDEHDLFYPVEEKGKGYWGIRNFHS